MSKDVYTLIHVEWTDLTTTTTSTTTLVTTTLAVLPSFQNEGYTQLVNLDGSGSGFFVIQGNVGCSGELFSSLGTESLKELRLESSRFHVFVTWCLSLVEVSERPKRWNECV